MTSLYLDLSTSLALSLINRMSEPTTTTSLSPSSQPRRNKLLRLLSVLSRRSVAGANTLQWQRQLPRWQRHLSLSLVVNIFLAVVTIGSTIAAFLLAFIAKRRSTVVANDVAFIIVSYLGAFGPFQVIETADYIGPKWKTLFETRRIGRLQFVVGIFGLATVVLYTHFQRVSEDYKEMSAALVILLFSILNLARTVRGLDELAEFKRWAVVSIDTLHRLGVVYRIDASSVEDISASELADKIKINEIIVDNKIYNGRTLFRIYTPLQVLDVRTAKHKLPRELPDIMMETEKKEFWARFNNMRDSLLPLVPTHPVELWLDWATVFAAQGLKCWLTNHKWKLPHAELCEAGCNCYAKPKSRGASADVNSGTEQTEARWKRDLETAMRYGAGLPFRAPHLLKEKHHDDDLKQNEYKSYTAKLARGIEALPPDFGMEIQKFDTAFLARLVVMLSGGADFCLPAEP